MFNIRNISINKLMYLNAFLLPFCMAFVSAGIATHIGMHVCISLFLFLIAIPYPFAITSLYVCAVDLNTTYR